MKLSVKYIFAFLCFTALSACGGGSAVGNSENIVASTIILNAVPIANAGPDLNVIVGSMVTLDAGSSSDANGDALTFRWRLTAMPLGSAAVFSSTTVTRPTFVPDVAGVFTASLIANDGKSDSIFDSVSITAILKTTAIIAPIANAGPSQSVAVGTTVKLNGMASSSVNSNQLTYRWTLLSKPSGSGASLLNHFSSTPTFVADAVGTYAALLIVNNVVTDSAPAIVVVTAVAAPSAANTPPIANAGADQKVLSGSTVELDGSLSKDPNGDHLSYAWSFASKPQSSMASISLSSSVNPTFRADISGTYDLRLIVNDGKIDSISGDVISVVAMSASVITIADTGIYRCASLSKDQALILYAQGHTYLDRDHDGKPCESNDVLNELSSPYVAPPSTGSSGKCYVNGYYRKSGTYVRGYYRSC